MKLTGPSCVGWPYKTDARVFPRQGVSDKAKAPEILPKSSGCKDNQRSQTYFLSADGFFRYTPGGRMFYGMDDRIGFLL